MKKLALAFALAFSAVTTITLAGCSSDVQSQGIEIKDAWVRSSEYSANAGGMTGVFAKITNNSDKDVQLVGGSTDWATMVQTHEVVGGTMQPTDGGIVIAKGETVTLEPGGLHVMLMGLTAPIVAGDVVPFTFKFNNGAELSFDLVAKESAGGDETYNK